MEETFFSLLVPTRDRAVTLDGTLRCLSAMNYNNYEIVVMDNQGGPEVKELINTINSPKIKYFRTHKVLAMPDNFEACLNESKGDYICVIGDDDGLMPSTLTIINDMILKSKAEILKLDKHQYHWPSTGFEGLGNMLYLTPLGVPSYHNSRKMLQMYYDTKITFAELPCAYKNFVSRKVVNKIKDITGNYFFATSPDVGSGIANLFVTEMMFYTGLPLVVNGISGSSSGCACFFRSKGKKVLQQSLKEFGKKNMGELLHPDLIDSAAVPIGIADSMIRVKERMFPDDDSIKVNMAGIIQQVISNLLTDPASYYDNLNDAKKLAKKHNIRMDRYDIPPYPGDNATIKISKRQRGFSIDKNGALTGISVDCNLTGGIDVADAAKLAEGIMPDMLAYWTHLWDEASKK